MPEHKEDIMQETSVRGLDPLDIEAAIAATAKERARATADYAASMVVKAIENVLSGCNVDQAVTREQMVQDVVDMIVKPVIKGGKAEVPSWLEKAYVIEIIESARSFICRTQERFTPLPLGSANISPYQLEEIISEDGISLICSNGDEANSVKWIASSKDIVGNGVDPTSALNDYFRKKKISEGLI
jgi:hypothetical protein